jgi:hypothetical protein
MTTVTAAYAGISANEGESRDWGAFHSLFLPGARLVSVWRNESGIHVNGRSVADWIVEDGLGLEGQGFVEDFVPNEIEAYGPIAHVFTTWVTREERGGATNGSGAATLQLVRTGDGWRVAGWIWTGAIEGLPLPGLP